MQLRKQRMCFIPTYSDYSTFLCAPIPFHSEIAILDWTLNNKELYYEINDPKNDILLTKMTANDYSKTMLVKRMQTFETVSAVDCHVPTGDLICGSLGNLCSIYSTNYEVKL